MGNLTKQNTFTDGTDIVAGQVNVNFDDIIAFINNQLIHRDGTKDFTALPTGPALDPTGPNHLSRKAYVDARDAAVQASVDQLRTDATNADNDLRNTKLDKDALRHGFVTGTTNPAGDIVVTHNLGRSPGSIQLTPLADGANMPWKVVVQNFDTTTINVRMYDSTNGNAIPNAGVSFFWTVLG